MKKRRHYEIVRNGIASWYDVNKRDFPWRSTTNLYKILVTEIFLQKTIATNVKNIYIDFFNKYDNMIKILNTEREEIESDIKSLGLSKKRAKILKELSRMVVEEFNGEIPIQPSELTRVNGIADYVSRAFSCFGLGNRTIFFDVNIKRIIERVFNNFKDTIKIKDQIEQNLDKLLPESNCKHFYWALLDFAALICTKKNPKCESCLISSTCHYFSSKVY
ncbi:MAG: hypothetical protein JW891_05385 [Candidatus Lokiarchaeota archaeon]|nr:hypothetical protein [Candidatus Lokiarchaeota archaeon]